MFWNKNKAPSYLNSWYDASLDALGKKISRTLKEDKTYSNIPFGKSLIDIHSDGENAFINVKTIVDGELSIKEIHALSPYVSAYLHSSKIKEDWKNSDDEIVLTKESLKQVCVSMAELIHSSEIKKDAWVFPYFNYFITVKIDETGKQNGRKYVSGSASIRDFNGEYGSGGSISGTVFEDGEKVRDRDRITGLDFALHQTLFSSELGETIWRGKDWAAIREPENIPVGKVSLTRQ